MNSAAVIFVLVAATLLGLIVGSFLNVVVYRVPAGIPLTRGSRCAHCDSPVRWWHNVPVGSWLALGTRCATCRSPISARYPLVEATTGALFAVVTWWFVIEPPAPSPAASWTVAAAFLHLVAISVALTLIDIDTHRLPNAIVLPSYAVAVVLFVIACLLGSDWRALGRAAIGMSLLYAFYFILRVVRPDGMGGGDVKLAGVLGLYLGWLGWGALAVGAFGAFLLGGIFGALLLLRKRAGRRTAIPFGPWMILGAWTGVFAGEALGSLYLGAATGL
ncbi:prepilin peptidase [Microbacterium pumilum]|uniref:Prepilin leader peptidase/N-methyltransferase n=1 Tax=Microbacterium pumilum TaxID=344165 RepID=A0ABN2SIJ8_9MICO